MSLRINSNVEAFNAHRKLVGTSDQRREVDGAPVARATASTARPMTPPASRSARSCVARSVASTRPSATRRTASPSSRRLRAR